MWTLGHPSDSNASPGATTSATPSRQQAVDVRVTGKLQDWSRKPCDPVPASIQCDYFIDFGKAQTYMPCFNTTEPVPLCTVNNQTNLRQHFAVFTIHFDPRTHTILINDGEAQDVYNSTSALSLYRLPDAFVHHDTGVVVSSNMYLRMNNGWYVGVGCVAGEIKGV